MKCLGDLILPNAIQWTDRWEWSPVAQETARTLGGTAVFWSQPLSGGRPITLDAEESVTWLSAQQVEAIAKMAAQAGAVFTLAWDSDLITVMFRHQDPPAIQFKAIWPNYHLFTGSIKLITV